MYAEYVIDMVIFTLSALISLAFPISLRIGGRTKPLLYSTFLFLCIVVIGIYYPSIQRFLFPYKNPSLSFLQLQSILALQVNPYWIYVFLEYMTAAFVGFNWFIFALYYNRQERHGKWSLLLLILPLFSYGYIFYNSFNCFRLFSSNANSLQFLSPSFFINGMPLWIHYAILLSCFLGGVIFFIGRFFKQHGHIKTLLLFATASIPFIINILPVLFTDPLHQTLIANLHIRSWFDPVPIRAPITYTGYLIALITVTVVAFKYCIIDVVPIAFRKIVDSMNTMMILVDTDNRILDFNQPFAKELFGNRKIKRNTPLSSLIDILEAKSNGSPQSEELFHALRTPEITNLNGNFDTCHPYPRFYTVTIQPIIQWKDEVLGRVIAINDITDYRNLIGELAIEKERTRFARDIHDTLGHTLTKLIALLEVSKIDMKTDPISAQEKLDKSISIARNGLVEICDSIHGLISEKSETESLTTVIRNVIDDFQSSGLNIEFSTDGSESPCSPAQIEAIYRVCQEGLTNALRHGKAQNATIHLRYEANQVKLFIFDDGVGCSHVVKGMGLAGMEQRVKALQGTLFFGSDGEHGFNLRVEIPLKDPTLALA